MCGFENKSRVTKVWNPESNGFLYSVRGQNVLQSTPQCGYEHFLEQVNLAEQLKLNGRNINAY